MQIKLRWSELGGFWLCLPKPLSLGNISVGIDTVCIPVLADPQAMVGVSVSESISETVSFKKSVNIFS